MPPPRAGRRRASSARPLRYASAYFFVLIKFTQRKPLGVTLMSSSKRFEEKGGATLSRRALVGAAGVTAATVVAGRAFAQQPPPAPPTAPAAPPSTITTPPRDFVLGGAPTTSTSPIPTSSPSIQASMAGSAQCAHPAPVDRRAVVGGAGVERAGPLSRVERHPQQSPAALDRGQRPRQRLPQPVEQQQRQHLRLPGPAALVRAPDAPCRARARRLGDRAG